MKSHIEITVPKLSAACFAIGVVKPCMTCNTLQIIYYHLPSITSYGLIFWGNTSHSNSVFKVQSNNVRTITGNETRQRTL